MFCPEERHADARSLTTHMFGLHPQLAIEVHFFFADLLYLSVKLELRCGHLNVLRMAQAV